MTLERHHVFGSVRKPDGGATVFLFGFPYRRAVM